MTDMALADENMVMEMGGLDDGDRTLVRSLVTAASAAAAHYCRRQLLNRPYEHIGQASLADRRVLLLREYPATRLEGVWEDPQGLFGDDTSVPRAELELDTPVGVIRRRNGSWPAQPRSVRVNSRAGYYVFTVEDRVNDRLDFEHLGTSRLTAELQPGRYAASELAAMLEQRLNAAGATYYRAAYDSVTMRFSIHSPLEMRLLLYSGEYSRRSAADLLGFAGGHDTDWLFVQQSNEPRPELPHDIQLATVMTVLHWLERRYALALSGEQAGALRVNFHRLPLPPEALHLLQPYRRLWGGGS